MDTLEHYLRDLAARIRSGDSAAVERCVSELVPLIARVVLAGLPRPNRGGFRGRSGAQQDHHHAVALATQRVTRSLIGDSPRDGSTTAETVFG